MIMNSSPCFTHKQLAIRTKSIRPGSGSAEQSELNTIDFRYDINQIVLHLSLGLGDWQSSNHIHI